MPHVVYTTITLGNNNYANDNHNIHKSVGLTNSSQSQSYNLIAQTVPTNMNNSMVGVGLGNNGEISIINQSEDQIAYPQTFNNIYLK